MQDVQDLVCKTQDEDTHTCKTRLMREPCMCARGLHVCERLARGLHVCERLARGLHVCERLARGLHVCERLACVCLSHLTLYPHST